MSAGDERSRAAGRDLGPLTGALGPAVWSSGVGRTGYECEIVLLEAYSGKEIHATSMRAVIAFGYELIAFGYEHPSRRHVCAV